MSTYKRICTPLVSYKNDDRIGIKLYDISVVNRKGISINLYHSISDEDCMTFEDKDEAIPFINQVLKNHDYRAKITVAEFTKHDRTFWYNIQWIDLDNYNVRFYGIKN